MTPPFPTEITVEILGNLDHQADLFNPLLVNSAFLAIGQQFLYRRFSVLINSIQQLTCVIQWCRTITTCQHLAQHVRNVELEEGIPSLGCRARSLQTWKLRDHVFPGPFVQLLIQALRRVKGLQVLRLDMHLWELGRVFDTLEFPQLRTFSFCRKPPLSWLPVEQLQFPARHPNLQIIKLNIYPDLPDLHFTSVPSLQKYTGPITCIQNLASHGALREVKTGASSNEDIEALWKVLETQRESLEDLVIHARHLHGAAFRGTPRVTPTFTIGLRSLAFTAYEGLQHDLKQVLLAILPVSVSLKMLHFKTRFGTVTPLEVMTIWVSLFHAACPTLLWINFQVSRSGHPSMWRYHKEKSLWLAPMYLEEWWQTTGRENGLSEVDFDALKPVGS